MKKNILLTLLSLLLFQTSVFAEAIKFVQVADAHFRTNDDYRESVLTQAIKDINKENDISFVVFTGDNIDSPKPEYVAEFTKIAF